MHTLDPSHRNFFRRRLRRAVLIQLSRVSPADVAFRDASNDDLLFAAERAANLDRVSRANGPVRLCRLAVHLNLAARARFLRLRSRPEQTRHIEPHIETNGGCNLIGVAHAAMV